MENLILNDKEFRIKKMNAIDLLALRTQISFNDFESAKLLYATLLEKIEVNINNKWISVKEPKRDVYFPNGIEEDVNSIQSLLDYFLEYMKSVFPKSSD